MTPTAAFAAGTFVGRLYPTLSTPLTVSQFIPGKKPGNVAVCLSGGGSRALSAGMGQLNGLSAIQPQADGGYSSALTAVKALSTVSGGSWVGVPFVYLPDSVSDADYLGGPYVQPGQLTRAGLGALPKGCIGSQVTGDFSITDMLIQALFLYWLGVPTDMLWQTIIAFKLLAPYGLFPNSGLASTPDSFFTYDATTHGQIVQQNSQLSGEAVSLVNNADRPYLVCNTALFVNSNGQSLLAPVQAGSFFTGVVSEPPNATDANGFQVGGGGVASFAFNSVPTQVTASGSQVTVQQSRQWALVDIVGSSSAAFAATLAELAALYAKNPELLATAMRERGPAARNALARNGISVAAVEVRVLEAVAAHARGDLSVMSEAASALSDLVPAYQYWPVLNPPVNKQINTTEFADAGSLDNSGLASLLAYADIQSVMVFTNTSSRIYKDPAGIIVVDESIPPLFGFQPYVAGTGYVLYKGHANPIGPLYQNNQVFPCEEFQTLLTNLWNASGAGSYQDTPMYVQNLTTVGNKWFNVTGGRKVTVLWTYLERTKAWYDLLTPDVQSILGPFDAMLNDFPHYSTFDTELSATEVNLLANLTAWTVVNSQAKFTELFR